MKIIDISDVGGDIIDSRDIVEACKFLDEDTDEAEVKALIDLNKEGEDTFSEWTDGVTLVRDSYFEQYARDFADDIGALKGCDNWPATCIDWEKAASELQMDYTSIEIDGVTYWGR